MGGGIKGSWDFVARNVGKIASLLIACYPI